MRETWQDCGSVIELDTHVYSCNVDGTLRTWDLEHPGPRGHEPKTYITPQN